MLKKKIRSEGAIPAPVKPESSEVDETPYESLNIKILSLRIPDEDPKEVFIKVTYFDQLILKGVIRSICGKDLEENRIWAEGKMNYDPSDYEKMCLFADHPLVVHIQLLNEVVSNVSGESFQSKKENLSCTNSIKSNALVQQDAAVYCCNIDVLQLFLSNKAKPPTCIKKHMEPIIKPSVLACKSWDCLPLLTLELCINRHKCACMHHEILKDANYMKLTLIAAYNMPISFKDEYEYTAASKTLFHCESNTSLATYNRGTSLPLRFKPTNFYPKWESLRLEEVSFAKCDEKFMCNLEDIQNDYNIDIRKYITAKDQRNTVVWGSFHRSLLIKKESEKCLSTNIQKYKWPLEVHICGENKGYSFMAFLNLFQLLYPGVKRICIAAPLQWINSETMREECDSEPLLTPNDKPLFYNPNIAMQKPTESRMLTGSVSSNEAIFTILNTGADENNAFVLIEVKLARALKKVALPTHISNVEMKNMLKEAENTGTDERQCTGRGQLVKKWQSTVRAAAASLRRVPYYGTMDFCAFHRQLSETRTHVEILTSFWQEAAVYVNNNFVIQQYLESEEIFKELIMMAHVCLVKLARDTLLKEDIEHIKHDPILRAARQARQMQDIHHALHLYLQAVVQKPRDANYWRELSTCLIDIDRNWANVCLNKAVVLNPRHPLTLVSKGGMLFEDKPAAAEHFIRALIAYYPFWTTAWIIASAYYYDREYFLLADKILDTVKVNRRKDSIEELGYARNWERELGDWWDSTPLLPSMSPFYDAADLLLRLRCIRLAEVCIARALTYSGESSAYYHMVALCCRLRGNYKEALYHIRTALEKYDEIIHLRALEAECLHKLNNIAAAMASYEKASNYGPFNTLMSLPIYNDPQRIRAVIVDLVRRMPSAYAWMALAHDWMKKVNVKGRDEYDSSNVEEQIAAKSCAIACAIEALKWDRRAGSAWALLANNVKPSARRHYCINMTYLCGYKLKIDHLETNSDSQQSLCYRLGAAITMCRCSMCEYLLI